MTTTGTDRHTVRYPRNKWEAAMAQADSMGTNLSALLCTFMDALIQSDPRKCPNPWHESAPARTDIECPECPTSVTAQAVKALEPFVVTDEKTVKYLLSMWIHYDAMTPEDVAYVARKAAK